MNPVLTILTLLVCLSAFTLILGRRVLALGGLRAENRSGDFMKRLGVMWRVGFRQEKMIGRKRERVSGWMHAIIFWGFLALLLRTVTLVGQGFDESFHLPFMGPEWLFGYIYLLFKDLFEGAVFFAVLFAMYRRYVLKVSRLYNTPHALFILVMELIVIFSDTFFEVFKFRLIMEAGNPYNFPLFYSEAFGNEWSYTPFAWLTSIFLMPISDPETMYFGMHVMFVLHVASILGFLCYLPINKHFHVLTALPNVFWSSLGYPHTRPEKVDLEDEVKWENEDIGVKYLHQLTWKQGLDLYTCTECGRCQEICPTFVTGKPLDLKTFNDSLKHPLYEENDRLRRRMLFGYKIHKASEPEQVSELTEKMNEAAPPVEIVGNLISEDTLWACTTCRACEEVCPVGIEHVPRIISMRTAQTLMEDQYPSEVKKAFSGLERNYNPWGVGYDRRADWADKLGFELKLVGDKLETEYLLWVGCAGSFDERAQSVAAATVKILTAAGVDFSILGSKEKCTGEFARRAGNEMLFQNAAMENVETLNEAEVRKIITFCPHCLNTLRHEYPDFGGNYEVIHHSEMISRLITSGKIKTQGSSNDRITYHDPCYLGRYNQTYAEPRDILKSVTGKPVEEMKYSGKESFCCGAGGARMWMEEDIGKRINTERAEQAGKTGADTLATGCPFCLNMLDSAVKGGAGGSITQVRDIAEIVYDSMTAKDTE